MKCKHNMICFNDYIATGFENLSLWLVRRLTLGNTPSERISALLVPEYSRLYVKSATSLQNGKLTVPVRFIAKNVVHPNRLIGNQTLGLEKLNQER